MAEEQSASQASETKKKNKYRRDKPWDDETIDHWKTEVYFVTFFILQQFI